MLDLCNASANYSELLNDTTTCYPCIKHGVLQAAGGSVISNFSGNYIDYTSFVLCNGLLNPLGIGFSITWLAILFVTLATTADEFFCPSLEIIAKSMKCSQNVAGVTLLAFGNGAPEIFASFAGANKQRTYLVISYLLGSGIFLTCIVAGTIVFVTPFKMVELPFLRDVVIYIIATFWTFWVLWGGKITLYHALGFVAIYLIYLTVVLVVHQIQRKWCKNYKEMGPVAIAGPSTTDPRSMEQTRSLTSSKTRSLPLKGDEITPWAVPPFIKHWSISNEMDRIANAANIQPITEESFESTESTISVTARIQCEHCYEHRHDVDVSLRTRVRSWFHRLSYELAKELCPIDFLTWNKSSACSKGCQIIKIPVNIVLKLTIPVVIRWCRPLNALHCITSPLFFVFAIGYLPYKICGIVPLWSIFFGIGFVLFITVFATSTWDREPSYHMVFAVMGFVSSIVWVYIIANEIVGLLIALGGVFKISDSILGLTVLAWGNSINDVVADVTIAKEGYPEMGFSACFGGPLFNLLMGLGVSFTVAVLNSKTQLYKIIFHRTTKILIGFLFASLISSLIIAPCVKFELKRWYGVFLYALYIIFLTVVIVNECGLLENI